MSIEEGWMGFYTKSTRGTGARKVAGGISNMESAACEAR